jgi:hypothetical protein
MTSMYPFWVLSAWVLLSSCLAGGVLLLVAAVNRPVEHALPRATAGLSLVLSAVLVLVFCRSQAGQKDGLLRQSPAGPEVSDSAAHPRPHSLILKRWHTHPWSEPHHVHSPPENHGRGRTSIST